MGAEHVQLVRRGYEAWNSGDREWVLEHMSPDIEWVTPPDDPDPGTFKGYAGVERFWNNWRELFGLLRFEIEEIEDLGDHVLVAARRHARGEQSGVQIQEQVFQLFSFDREGRCNRVQEFYDQTEARRVGSRTAGHAR